MVSRRYCNWYFIGYFLYADWTGLENTGSYDADPNFNLRLSVFETRFPGNRAGIVGFLEQGYV
ncbi:hypothetical protein D3C87_2081790 [compost metagenome]